MVKNFDSLGVMIDCSRNAVMNLDEIKRFIKLLAKMGYNQLQLYMEDTYEVEGEELFGYRRGKYSINELKEIVDFAEDYNIEVVPCVQTLAHLNAIFRWQKYREINDIDAIILVGATKTYELIEKMFKTLRKCFKTDKIHIGMDEANKVGKGKYRDLNGEREEAEIFLEHLNRVYEIAEKYGFKPMMWSDMFYRIANGGDEYYATNTDFSDAIKSKIPENVSLVYWSYSHIEQEFHNKMIRGHKMLTDKVIFGGGAWKWSGVVPHNNLSLLSIKTAFSACIENGVKNALITMWGDNGGEGSVYTVLPSLCTAACINMGIFDYAEIKAKFKEWTGCDYDNFMLLDLPDLKEGFAPNRIINPSKYQLYNDCFLGFYDQGGVDEGDGKNYREISVKLKKAANEALEYKYIFDTIAALCDVLEFKAEIGIRTRKAYMEGNRSELEKIIGDYCEMIDRTEEFYNLLRKQWHKENKPYGFEVQDIRLGGLIMRMKNCCSKIEEYLAGETDKICELEETPIKIIENKDYINNWRDTVTASVL